MRALRVRATNKNAYQAEKVAFRSLLPTVVPAAGLLGKRTGNRALSTGWRACLGRSGTRENGCARNPQISDEFAPICPQLSRSIDAVWTLRHGICQTTGFAKRNASKFATIRGHTRPGTGAALSLL